MAQAWTSLLTHLRSSWPGLLAGFIVVLVFVPAVGFDWVWDDSILILENVRLHGVEGLWAGLSGGLWDHTPSAHQPPIYYRPVMRWSLVLDDALGLRPGLGHLHSLCVHLLAVVGLAALLRRLTDSPELAGLGAALYGLHPVQVEAVGWVSARNDLQAAAASIWAAWWLLGASGARRWVGVLGCTAIAAGSKESAYLLPLALAALAWGWHRQRERAVLAGLAASVGGVACLAAARLAAGVAWPPGADVAHLTASAGPIAGAAVEALVWPVGRAPGLHLAWPEPLCLAAVAGGSVALLALVVRGGRPAVGAVVFSIVTALPAWAAVAHVGLFGDRYLVLPLVGIVVALAAASQARALRGLLLVAVLVCAGLSSRTLPIWRDDLTLWTAAADRHPNPHTAGALAKTLELSGELDAAAGWYGRATVAPRPLEHACWNVAAVHLKRGRPGDAATAGQRALDSGCPPSGELVCPTALGLLWTGRFEAGAALVSRADRDPAGLCRMVGLVEAARQRDSSALTAALSSDSAAERGALAQRLNRILEAGGDVDTVGYVVRWAQGTDEQAAPR